MEVEQQFLGEREEEADEKVEDVEEKEVEEDEDEDEDDNDNGDEGDNDKLICLRCDRIVYLCSEVTIVYHQRPNGFSFIFLC